MPFPWGFATLFVTICHYLSLFVSASQCVSVLPCYRLCYHQRTGPIGPFLPGLRVKNARVYAVNQLKSAKLGVTIFVYFGVRFGVRFESISGLKRIKSSRRSRRLAGG